MEEKLAGAPDSLRERVLQAVESSISSTAPSSPLPAPLMAAAESLLQEAKSAVPTRDKAVTLLAADALVTLACELVAAENPLELGRMR